MNTRPRRALLNPALQRPSALNSIPRDESQVWLDKNENLDPELMTLSRDVLASIPPLALATYPEAGELYRKLAAWLAVSPETVLLTPGSDGAIRLAFEAFVDTGDWVIHTSPTFAMYPVYGQMFGANVHEVSYHQTDRGPSLDVAEVIENVRRIKPKLVCLPNPDSPTGTVLAPSLLREVLTECEAAGSVLLLDEAYYPFYPWSAVSWTATSENLVVARTFAKAWGAAGMRIGYAVGHPATIALLHKMRPMYEVSTLAVEFMSRMLDKKAEMADAVARIQAGKAFFVAAMRSLGFAVLPTEGNFVHVAFGRAAPDVHAQLTGKVLYRAAFAQPCLAGYSRFSVAPLSIMTGVVDLISRAVEKTHR